MLVETAVLPADTLPLLTRIRENIHAADAARTGDLLQQCDNFLSRAASILESAQ